MTLNLAAIFGAEPSAIMEVVIAPVAPDLEVAASAVAQVEAVAMPYFEPWPIVEGTEHYQVFVPDEDTPWLEFIPGYHFDFRQPSRLRPLLTPNDHFPVDEPKTNAQDAPGIAPTGWGDS